MSCKDPPPQYSIQIHSFVFLQYKQIQPSTTFPLLFYTSHTHTCVWVFITGMCLPSPRHLLGHQPKHKACITLPVVAAIIGHNVLMLALLHGGDLLLDRWDVVSCKEENTLHYSTSTISSISLCSIKPIWYICFNICLTLVRYSCFCM